MLYSHHADSKARSYDQWCVSRRDPPTCSATAQQLYALSPLRAHSLVRYCDFLGPKLLACVLAVAEGRGGGLMGRRDDAVIPDGKGTERAAENV